jgi:hypothetical protein
MNNEWERIWKEAIEENHENPVRISDLPAEIRIEYLPNTNPER